MKRRGCKREVADGGCASFKIGSTLTRSLLGGSDVDNKTNQQGVYNIEGMTHIIVLFGPPKGESNKL